MLTLQRLATRAVLDSLRLSPPATPCRRARSNTGWPRALWSEDLSYLITRLASTRLAHVLALSLATSDQGGQLPAQSQDRSSRRRPSGTTRNGGKRAGLSTSARCHGAPLLP